jgi:hypothetical protein
VASVWVKTRRVKDGKRYRVEYRLGGRETQPRYAGSFKTLKEATTRKRWIAGELAARRVPDIAQPKTEPNAPTLGAAGDAWRASRVDVVEGTATCIDPHSAAFSASRHSYAAAASTSSPSSM